LVYLTAVVVCK